MTFTSVLLVLFVVLAVVGLIYCGLRRDNHLAHIRTGVLQELLKHPRGHPAAGWAIMQSPHVPNCIQADLLSALRQLETEGLVSLHVICADEDFPDIIGIGTHAWMLTTVGRQHAQKVV